MASRIRTLNFLPEIFQTKTNSQFLAATLDQIVSQPATKKVEGYIGSKIGYGVNAKNYYVTEPTKVRTDYQLDPGVVFTKPNESVAKDFISYPGILDALSIEGGLTKDNNRLFESQIYSWDSFTNLDKIINFNQYYWLPEGPPSVVVSNQAVYYANDYAVYNVPNGYNIVPVNSGSLGSTNPVLTLLRGGTYSFAVNQDSQFWIQGAPGLTGYSPTQPNVQTREVLGVDNNGASVGIVTFTVPPKDAQDSYNFPGNNLVDVVSTRPFSEINGAKLKDLVGGIDGVTSLDGLTVMFYNTGIPAEVGYVSNFFDFTPFDYNNDLTTLNSITITATNASSELITCNSTANLVVGNAIIFNGTPFGNLSEYSFTLPNTIYYVHSILNSTEFKVSLTPNGPAYPVSTDTGTMTGIINQGQFEQGYYTNVNENFYRIQYLGEPSDPVLRLTQATEIPVNQKITAVYGTTWITRNFYKAVSGYISLIPYLSAQLDTLYYQDGTNSNKVGVIKLIESNATNTLDINSDILGKKSFTASNGVEFTNGLKVTFQGDVYPTSYLTGEYYVEGVGTAIELLPVSNFIAPEDFTTSTYVPWDVLGWDTANWEGNSYIPTIPDYITISRNSIDRNAWSRSNRWFHIDVIEASASYNNKPEITTLYATSANKAKRPIIEFYPNLKLFNSGIEGKAPADFIDRRTTDAFSYVAGNQNYYPDIEVYTAYSATITGTMYTPTRQILSASNTTGVFVMNSGYNTTGMNVNDLIIFDSITPGSGITPGGSYYISDIISSTQFKISSSKNGEVLVPSVAVSGPYAFNWSPQSTTITINSTDISGPISVGQYITDSTNVIPRNSQIISIEGTDTLTITIDWDDSSKYFSTQTNSSIVASDTTVDNYALFEGARVIFTLDTDAKVRNKIYTCRFSSIAGSTPVITLTEAQDGLVLPDQQTVALRGFYNHGSEFWFDGINWINGQVKTTLNQAPLFDVFDANNISFGNPDVYVGTSFVGCKLFAYGLGSGLDDSVLGFPIRYSSVDNIGDISFDVSLNLDTFNYVNTGTAPVTMNVNTGYVLQYSTRTDYSRQIGWQTAVAPAVQYQVFDFEYDVLIPTNTFVCDVSKVSNETTSWPTVTVLNNNIPLSPSEYSVTVSPDSTTITLVNQPTTSTVIQVLLLSDQVSKTAYYQIPTNLNNNPLNEDITVVNVGDIRGQYQSMFYNNPNTSGTVFGSNNIRDLGNMVPWGNKIIQNSASLVLLGSLLRKQDHNLFNALMFNSNEYVKFKNLLVYTVQNTDYVQRFDPAAMLDDALSQITASKTDNQPFFWSDMIPSKAAYITNSYSFANSLDVSIYPLSRVYDFDQSNYYGVLVYLIRTTDGVTVTSQLVKGSDYIVSPTSPSLTINTDLLPGDVITIKEYNQTYGSYVPNTPTKLGFYPSYIPSVVLDSDYTNPTYFIKGHDGSYTKLYGEYNPVTGVLEDFRDQVLLEFELRIYNNLKLSSEIPVTVNEVIPGFFRKTDYSYAEWLEIYSTSFLNWVGQNRLNYKTQYFNATDNFTYNYTQSGNAIDKAPITQGYWRGVYQYFYDTTTPNSTPWEMLGFNEMPSWWTTRYGPAPYTSDNLVLWGDLETGTIWNNGTPYINELYARPGLSKIIPVDTAGNLLAPIDSIVGSYNQNLFQRDWKVGDVAPVELSYRRSSSYPFDLMRMIALMKPAKFYNLGVAVDKYKYNAEFNQFLVNDRTHLKMSDIEVYGTGIPVTSYINWIVDYEKQLGVSATANITQLLNNLDVRLVYRLAGFSDKTMLKFYVEKGTPNSRNASLLIPDESFSVLLYDNQPFNKVTYSGVIVQQNANGYTVYGNSQSTSFFRTLKPKFAGKYETITIEDSTVRVTVDHYDTEQIVPYNTLFYTMQEVAQFLTDYGAYLESLGMKFTDTENGLQIDWYQMVGEFLYWAQTGWAEGSIVTLNPAARVLTIDKDSNIVQPMTIRKSNFVLNQNLYPIELNALSVVRDGTTFNVTALNEGDTIAYGQFNLSNFEHGIVFDNVTVFGDIIYNLSTGLRQNRIVLRGTKSAEWNGTVNAAGFIYNQDNITEWDSTVKYTKGEIVTYKNKYWVALKIVQPSAVFKEEEWKRTDYNEIQKGLLANSSTRSYESSIYYDVNKANLENDADLLGFSLIGYRPRDYLALADLTDITQVNVYKNLIKEKGTLNAASAFKGAQLPQGGIDYDIYENWAIKSGEFGGVLNSNFIEFKVNQKYLTGNPAIVGLTDGVYNNGVQQEIPLYSLYNYGRPVTSVNVLPVTSKSTPSMLYPDAGYVNFNDVKMSAFYYSQLPTAINKNGTIIPIQNFYVRDYVWLANYLEKWQVFTPLSMGVITSAKNNLNDTVTVTFKQAHNLKQYQPFVIVNFDDAIDGYYLATVIVDQNRVLISKTIDPTIKEITGMGVGMRLQSRRVATSAEIADMPLVDSEFRKNTVWVDTNEDGNWGVFRKSINYGVQNQITKSLSSALGSAVAINDQLGYLISDADLGEVYRYTFNDLSSQYQLTQTITESAGFGSTIAYAKDLYAIAEPTGVSRNVKLYQLQNTKLSDDLIEVQTITYPVGATTWGTSIAFSSDTNWLYISDVDNNTVHLYMRSNIPVTAGYFTVGETYTVTSLGTTDFTTVGATSNDIGVTFIATGSGSGTGTATNSTYRPVTTIDGDTLGLTTSGDDFGHSLSTNHNGSKLVVGAPFKDYNGMSNWGFAYVFERLEQNIEIQNSVVPATFPLIWTPTSLTGNVTATSSVGNKITLDVALDPVEDLNKPILFAGSGLAGTEIVANVVYYVATVSGYDITVKATRESGSDLAVATVASILNAYAYVQTEQLNVYRNGSVVTDDNYAVINNTIMYLGTVTPGDILTVSGHEIVFNQQLTTQEIPQIGAQFGISVDSNQYASEIIVGAPFELNSQFEEGAVYRFTDAGAKFGLIAGSSVVNVTTNREILINGFLVVIPAGNAELAADSIRNANVTNVTAAATDGKLVISLLNSELAQVNQKLVLSFDSYDTIQELGLEVYSKTQKITCPHTQGPTQFGTVVKFNQAGSFVASAPVGTRFMSTTFDFTDDENQDNDTVFDNNATSWIDQTVNFGAVYMFDYLAEYNASVQNPGKYVYAQSVNSPNLVSSEFNKYNQDTDITESLQPRYGTALDFNGYSIIIGTPGDEGSATGSTYAGSATVYNNPSKVKDWSLYRQSSSVVDVNRIFNIQLFSAETNNTLVNMDYIDPLNGKILGVARENIDFVSNEDPARYNNGQTVNGSLVWGSAQIGQIWLDTTNIRFVNYHQNDDVVYNAQYWGTLFPGSDVAVYSWVSSNVVPSAYQGPGIPYDINSYSIQYTVNASGALVPIYYFWARNTNTVFTNNGKTLADSIIAAYIQNPKASGISYFTPILSNVFALYNCGDYINANDSVLHIGYATGDNDDVSHSEFNLIRDGYASDFLPGVPPTIAETPQNLYDRLLDSLCGVDEVGDIVPNPYLPKSVQTGVLARPRQSFFTNRYEALKNYLQYANSVMSKYPITEIRQASFLNSSGAFYDTSNYWEFINWWAVGYDDNVKPALQVPIYADLSTLTVPAGTIVTVAANSDSKAETYILEPSGAWTRIGLENGTIAFKSSLWDYASVRLGYGDNFFDTDLYDLFPSEETRKIIRALNEQIYTSELMIHRNKSLILLFEFIQSESSENQNYLPWLNKTSFVDVAHTIRELQPIEVFQSDNQDFLAGYLNEVKPYHVVIKEFLFKYTGEDVFEGNITDFDLPAKYDASTKSFVSPQLRYSNANGVDQFSPNAAIWGDSEYSQWYSEHGVSLTGQKEVQLTTLASFISLNSGSFAVDNAQGFPINGVVLIGTELIGYAFVDRASNVLSGLTRGMNGTTVSTHIPGELIYMDLPAVIVLDGGRGYIETPKVTAYIDPMDTKTAEFVGTIDGTTLTVTDILSGEIIVGNYISSADTSIYTRIESQNSNGTYELNIGYSVPVANFIQYAGPTEPAQLEAVMSLDSVLSINVINPGQGYAVLPKIIIDPAVVLTFTSAEVSTISSTVKLYAPLLQTGDLVQYKAGIGSTPIGGLENNQWYYVNVLETDPSVTIGFYSSYFDAVNNSDRLPLYTTGTGFGHTLNMGAKASAISTAVPVRENNIVLRFDRTSYGSKIIDWESGKYYGAFYAGSYHNSESVSSSSITLESTQPLISTILASAQGVAFEITDVSNERVVTYSSFNRNVLSTETTDNSIRLILQDDGSGNPNASGGTIGFYVGMPVEFVGGVGLSGLQNGVMYYVHSILNQTDFTVSVDPTGSPILPLNDWVIGAEGLQCKVGEVVDTGVITVNYPGILQVTATNGSTNMLTTPLNPTGTGGTAGFYINLPIFFTGNDASIENNGVYGGIVENQVYYITTVVDNETFTMSETTDPKTFNVLSTSASTDSLVIDGDTSKLSINEPVILNTMVIAGTSVNSFGGLISGQLYYVSSIVGPNSFTVSTDINGVIVSLTDVVAASNTSALLTSQSNTVKLVTGSGNSMTLNVSLPVSPGQVDGQLFNLYETSVEYPNIIGQDISLINRDIAALINSRSLPVNNIVVGETYTIATIGTTDFTLIGAASNTVGISFVATGVGIGTGTVTTAVNKIVLTNFMSGTSVALWLDDIYVNMPFNVSIGLGTSFLNPATTYYVVDKGIIEVSVTSTSSSGNLLRCESTASLFENMPISFSGTGIGGVQIDVEYWVKNIVDNQHFTITNTPGGLELVLTTASGLMTGTGLPYIQASTSLAGSITAPGDTQQTATISIATPGIFTVSAAPDTGTKVIFRTTGVLPGGVSENTVYFVTKVTSTTFKISLTPSGSFINTTGSQSGIHTMLIDTQVSIEQAPISVPMFGISYILGGYKVIIQDSGLGYAVNNQIAITGSAIGGTAPDNNLLLTVNAIGPYGEITEVICNGKPAGIANQYYLKVISPNQFALFENQLMTVPVSGINLPYVGTGQSSVLHLNSSTDQLTLADISGFEVNDAVVFTGDMTPAVGSLVKGQTYYITSISGSDVTVSTEPAGSNVNILTTIDSDFLMAKSGSMALLPEPFTFNQSIVKYNNRVYVCVVSNNDQQFVFGKWELLDSGDRRLNAMDRVYGYYQPTDNMPGVDLTQLFYGVTYPNSTYAGNRFAPSEQYQLDTILQDQPFYPTEIDITAVAWDGSKYVATSNLPVYSGVITSEDATQWYTQKLANEPISTTDILVDNGYYIITTGNAATPIYRSQDGITWTTSGYFTPWGSTPYDETNYDVTSLDVASLYLNSVGYRNGVWVAVGQNIVSSADTYTWYERFAFENNILQNELYGVKGVEIASFSGFVAVGKGQEFDYSGPVTEIANCNLLITSADGVNWNRLTKLTDKGFYAVTNNSDLALVVGESGVIYISNNGLNWTGVNEVQIISVNASTDQLNVTSTAGFVVNDQIKFNKSFNVFVAGTTYYVQSIDSDTQLKVSLTPSGSPMVLTSVNPTTPTYMFAPGTATLRDVYYANSLFVAAGDLGLIRTSTDGFNWATVSSGTTENLNGITFNETSSTWLIVGDNNTVLESSDAVIWTNSSVFETQKTTYDVQGAEFEYGYGPEELVPGVVTDNVTLTVATRPGTDWDETVYAHVGYSVTAVELSPESATQTVYGFDGKLLYNSQTPARLSVYLINGTTGVATTMYEPEYTVNWVDNTITLAAPIAYLPVSDRLQINVYEVGNGNQLVKASTKTDPIRINTTTGWNEIYVNCNYSGQIYDGSGVVRPGTFAIDAEAIETDSSNNTITCVSVADFILNDPISFQGAVFGGLVEDTIYYVKTISYVTNKITISTTVNPVTGTAGPTHAVTSDTGSMTVVIKTGYGAPWTAPIVLHNGSKLLIGVTSTVTKTRSTNNAIVTNTTNGMIVNEKIRFSDTMFGGVIVPQQQYYIKDIIDDNEFTISLTPGGAVVPMTDSTGGAELITNDYSFGIADNGVSAAIVFANTSYDSSVDYITYTLFGETMPVQYGYSLPESQIIVADGTVGPFDLVNYVAGDNPTNAVVEVNGVRLTSSDYSIDPNANNLTFTVAPTIGDIINVVTYNLTDRQYLNTQYGITGKTVSKITNISNSIAPYATVTTVTNTTSGTNYITCTSTDSMSPGQPVEFKGATPLGNIQVDGTVYFIKQVISGTEFTISATPSGTVFTLNTDSGTLVAYVGGQPAIRVTTSSVHNLSTNDLVKIDGAVGSTQLNANDYYVHVINSTQVDLYTEPYDSGLAAINYPVTDVSSYSTGGYIWMTNDYVLVTETVTQTTTDPILGNFLTVGSTETLVEGTPVIFTGTVFGGIEANTVYYIKLIMSSTEFSISETHAGSEFELSNAVGTMAVTQWEQFDVSRLTVTVNGHYVPATSLRLYSNNQVGILTTIDPSDEVIITSMMPSATPNEEVFLINVDVNENSSVFRANTQTRTWLTAPLSITDDIMYVDDVTRLTNSITQTSIVPTVEQGVYRIGLNADKRSISSVAVFNVTLGVAIPNSYCQVVIENMAPVIKIQSNPYINTGDTVTMTIVEGNTVLINGEQIKFGSVDLTNNTLSNLQRGANGTGAQLYHPLYAETFSLLSSNQMALADYYKTWNSKVYNTVEGDPLQISLTTTAEFLRGDIN